MNTGGMAFPGFDYTDGRGPCRWKDDHWEYFQPGMTLRDYFAAAAMNGIIVNAMSRGSVEELVETSYRYADAMLKERDK